MTVRESGEMYLEAILVLAKKSGYVRSIDVSEYLGYSKPSVSRAMGILREGGYILMEKDGAITLTEGRPAWTKPQCVRCLGCLHRCPVEAIHWKKGSEAQGRYYNPRVEP